MIFKVDKINGLYILQGEILNDSENVVISTVLENTELWHLRLGHISQRGLHEIVKQGLLGNDKIKDLEFCEHCIYGKSSRVKFSHAIHRTKETLDYVHSDSWGPAPVISHGGNRYFLTIIDDCSRRVWVYLLKHKNEALDRFKT